MQRFTEELVFSHQRSRGHPVGQHKAALRNGPRQLLSSDAGNAGIEYAVLIAAIVSSLCVAAFATGLVTRDSFSQVRFGPATNNTIATTAGKTPSTSGPGLSNVHYLAFVGTGILLTVVTIVPLFYLRRNKRGPEDVEEFSQGTEFVDESTYEAIFGKRQQILRLLSTDQSKVFESRIHAENLMSRELTTAPLDMPATEVEKMMSEKKLRHVLVLGNDGQLRGIISDRDLRMPGAKTASDLMTPDPITVDINALISPTVTLLVNRRISCLPVTEDGKLCGVVTTTDLLFALQSILKVLEQVSIGVKSGAHDLERSHIEVPLEKQTN